MISIVIPTYEMNGFGADFLRYNISRILQQDYHSYEIIVSDNSENLDIYNALRYFADSRIRYYKCDKKGSSANTNNGMKQAAGELIKIIFQDDYLYSQNCLSELLKAYKSTGKEWYAFTRVQVKNNKPSGRIIPYWNKDIPKGVNTISAPTAIAIKNGLDIWFDENLNWYMDTDFYTQLYNKYGEPFIIKNAVIASREWGGQVSETITKEVADKELTYLKEKYDTL